ncbi:exodeoxyribonuclease VII large subunit [Desulfovibrio sp. OttesenSCG-928-G15]|nr:exodeoxyribonuclease VII large subunit [Desulfovibrio sp. OttesenSCG-928-G15]
MQDDHIFSVSALTNAIKGTLESTFPFVWVRGQVANLSRPTSGHVYFSLKDEQSSLSAVWFKGSQKEGERFDPLTGEVFEGGPRPSIAASLENGQEIVCAGRIAVYGPRGVYQLVVEIAQDAGLGRLHEEFSRLTAKLEALGYFAQERKRPLPPSPQRIALVTAPGGAAIHDFLRIGETRGLAATIRLYPVQVQGEHAPGAILAALKRIADENWAELVVLIRGGGSLEDLWAFNDEKLATAIYDFPLPVLAGVGHEVDFTLADLTADVRAATPSHAAQLLWPERAELSRRLAVLSDQLSQTNERAFSRREDTLRLTGKELAWYSPKRIVSSWAERLAASTRFLHNAGMVHVERERLRLAAFTTSLCAGPKRLPALDDALDALTFRLERTMPQVFSDRANRLEPLERALAGGQEVRMAKAEHSLEKGLLRLTALNPHAPLERGYALVRKTDGRFVKTTSDVEAGELLRLSVSDGEIPVQVQENHKASGKQ